MSTKPSATSEYMTPDRMPPMTTSPKNSGPVRMAIQGSIRIWNRKSMRLPACSASPSMAHAEIGFDDGFVALHFRRRSIGDLGAVVQHHDAIRQVHHHAHVVLDEGNRGVERVLDGED